MFKKLIKGKNTTAAQPDTDKKTDTIVVYYSVTRNTKKVAQKIAENLKSDILEIEPKHEYTSDDIDYSNDNCRANKEMKDKKARPEIANDLSRVDSCDKVYIRYPVWWGTAPRIVQTFIEKNNDGMARAIAETLDKRHQLLKILSMNHYDLEENSRIEMLTEFKMTYGRTLETMRDFLTKFRLDMDEQKKMNLYMLFCHLCLEYIHTP
ncbi:flavodoxin [uncultured Eubacterium sp.]|uniref:flavodoxin n=2 Tax=uncultured Eubacterium sp. TaxID=165185 RepID=UPI002673334B|nr:flavodoxin [uncultured Eubacterium sp.]